MLEEDPALIGETRTLRVQLDDAADLFVKGNAEQREAARVSEQQRGWLEELEAEGFRLDKFGNFVKEENGRLVRFLRLYEAKMMHQFDHRFGTYEGQSPEDLRKGHCRELTPEEKTPEKVVLPRYWVREEELLLIRAENTRHKVRNMLKLKHETTQSKDPENRRQKASSQGPRSPSFQSCLCRRGTG